MQATGTAVRSERLREPIFHELSEFRCRLELRNGPSSVNADVKAFERFQIVRSRNSSYFGSSTDHLRSARDASVPEFAFHERRGSQLWRLHRWVHISTMPPHAFGSTQNSSASGQLRPRCKRWARITSSPLRAPE